MHEIVDVGDPFLEDSSWADTAYSFDYSLSRGSEEVTFRSWLDNQKDKDDPMGAAYGRCCFVYAARLARRIENALERGEPLTTELFERADRETDDSPGMHVSGAQHGFVIAILTQTWKHGATIRNWSNSKRIF